MERKIGEIFECQGEWYQCVEDSGCISCDIRFTEANTTCFIKHGLAYRL